MQMLVFVLQILNIVLLYYLVSRLIRKVIEKRYSITLPGKVLILLGLSSLFIVWLLHFFMDLNALGPKNMLFEIVFLGVSVVIGGYLLKIKKLRNKLQDNILKVLIYLFYITHLYIFFVPVYVLNFFLKKKGINYFYSIENIVLITGIWIVDSIIDFNSGVAYIISGCLVLISMIVQYYIYRYPEQIDEKPDSIVSVQKKEIKSERPDIKKGAF